MFQCVFNTFRQPFFNNDSSYCDLVFFARMIRVLHECTVIMHDVFLQYLQLVYVSVTFFKHSDLVKSQAGLGVSGVFLVLFAMAGGLGCCAIIGIPFNATTTKIIPFLALGMGVNSMFLLIPTYAVICGNSQIPHEVRHFFLSFFFSSHMHSAAQFFFH